MRCAAVFTLALAFFAGGAGAASGDPLPQEQQKAPAKKAKQSESKRKDARLTGCIDEQDGRYVLIREQGRELIADLIADGFPVEAFAKHVGHRVTVRGSSATDTSRPAFQVRSIETISDSCAPRQL